jgi:hypothetical protein
METLFHHFSSLFAQLGLPNSSEQIKLFIQMHSPLSPEIRLEDASFWTPSQAALLREEIIKDADWAEVVDQLNAALR